MRDRPRPNEKVDAMERHGAAAALALGASGVPRVRELRIDGEPIPGGIAR